MSVASYPAREYQLINAIVNEMAAAIFNLSM